MRIITRARTKSHHIPRKLRAAEFDRAVAEFFMRIALSEAKKGIGRTAPNPAVGCVIVKSGRIVSRGYHRKAGSAHAEAVAIAAAKGKTRGADMFVTLEPCNHHGRTPPCSQAILDAGIRRVVYGSSDPNPLASGKGVARLRRAGVEVVPSVLAEECDRINRPFFKWMKTKTPLVTLKAAVTMDGKLASATGDSKWVTGEKAREHVHRLRDAADVVMVGAGTALADDPKLTTRVDGGRDAVRLVVDSKLRLPATLQLFTQKSPARTIVATAEREDSAKAKRLSAAGVEVWSLKTRRGRIDLRALLGRLGEAGFLHVLVEGGAELFASFLKEKLADELLLFIAPKVLGSSGKSWAGELGVTQMSDAMELEPTTVDRIGRDILIVAKLSPHA